MAKIFFKSEAHKARFLAAIQQIGKVYDGKLDQEYGAALYILSSDADLWSKVSSYVASDSIDIEEILEKVDLSGGYSVLVKLAGNLFNEQHHLDPLEFMRLDDSNFHVALTSLQLRRYSLALDDVRG